MSRGKSSKRGLTIALVVAFLIVGAVGAGYIATKKLIIANYEAKVKALSDQIDGATRNVYVAKQPIKMGEEITAEKLDVVTQLITNPEGLFQPDNIGTKALVNIPMGATMYAAYGSDIESETTSRLVEYTCLYLSATLNAGDYVDVRIRYQNGEDFSVLAKKQIENISIAAKSCHLVVNADELQMMASAIIDANEFDAVIYCTKYTAPSVQEPTPITYLARGEILSVLYNQGSSEYIDGMRKRGELEKRLIEFAETTERNPVDISNFGQEHGHEQSNTNGTGVTSMPGDDLNDAE